MNLQISSKTLHWSTSSNAERVIDIDIDIVIGLRSWKIIGAILVDEITHKIADHEFFKINSQPSIHFMFPLLFVIFIIHSNTFVNAVSLLFYMICTIKNGCSKNDTILEYWLTCLFTVPMNQVYKRTLPWNVHGLHLVQLHGHDGAALHEGLQGELRHLHRAVPPGPPGRRHLRGRLSVRRQAQGRRPGRPQGGISRYSANIYIFLGALFTLAYNYKWSFLTTTCCFLFVLNAFLSFKDHHLSFISRCSCYSFLLNGNYHAWTMDTKMSGLREHLEANVMNGHYSLFLQKKIWCLRIFYIVNGWSRSLWGYSLIYLWQFHIPTSTGGWDFLFHSPSSTVKGYWRITECFSLQQSQHLYAFNSTQSELAVKVRRETKFETVTNWRKRKIYHLFISVV